MLNHRRRSWLLRRLALGFVIALLAVPAAQAIPPESPTGWPYIAPQQDGLPLPGTDDKSGLGRPNAQPQIVVPEPQSWPGFDPQARSEDYAPIQVVSTSDGFDWGASATGAGVTFALILLAAGTLATIRHTGRQATV